jgi:hypothetical protein
MIGALLHVVWVGGGIAARNACQGAFRVPCSMLLPVFEKAFKCCCVLCSMLT